jgi:hypothetical protein
MLMRIKQGRFTSLYKIGETETAKPSLVLLGSMSLQIAWNIRTVLTVPFAYIIFPHTLDIRIGQLVWSAESMSYPREYTWCEGRYGQGNITIYGVYQNSANSKLNVTVQINRLSFSPLLFFYNFHLPHSIHSKTQPRLAAQTNVPLRPSTYLNQKLPPFLTAKTLLSFVPSLKLFSTFKACASSLNRTLFFYNLVSNNPSKISWPWVSATTEPFATSAPHLFFPFISCAVILCGSV